jgi:UDP-glucuronate 4-epimerase
VHLLEFIETIEKALGRSVKKEFMDLQPGDVPATYADVEDLTRDVGFKPKTPLAVGIGKFVEWYREYYKVEG